MTRLTTCPDAGAVASRAAEHIARELDRARDARGRADLALSGGTTPRHTYELLAARALDWSAVQVWFADERCVAPDDEESNFRLARETLLDGARLAAVQVHRMRGELGPDDGAAAYARELVESLPPAQHDGAPRAGGAMSGGPVLDLVVLGIGPDGHVASLFPGAPALDAVEDAICLGVRGAPKPPPQRITLSLGTLRSARACLLLATGAGKADAIGAMLGEPTSSVPASLLRRERLSVIVDDAAAPPGP